jgi:hypothetical protein
MADITVELDSDEQKEIIRQLIKFGQVKKINPMKLVLAMIQTCKIITDREGIELNDMLALLGHDDDPNLN